MHAYLLPGALKLLGMALALLGSTGCVSLERLVNVPAQPIMSTVNNYNTELHEQSIHIFNPISLDNRIAELQLEPRVEHLFFLIDQSADLATEFRGMDMRFFAREMVRRFAQTMPEKAYSGALVIFDRQRDSRMREIVLTRYSAAELEQSLDRLETMQLVEAESLALALDQLSELMSRAEGSAALILVTAWSQIDKSVERAVMRMRQRNRFDDGLHIVESNPESLPWKGGDSGVCLYTLGVGNRLSRSRLESVDSCGFSVAANQVAQPRDMAHFVQTVLYKGPADSDGDGIYNYRDHCPNTLAGRIVDYKGCLRFSTDKRGIFQ